MWTGYLRMLGVVTVLAGLAVFAGSASAALIAVDLDPTTHIEVTANACGVVDTDSADGTDLALGAASATHDHPDPGPPPHTHPHTMDAGGGAQVWSGDNINFMAKTTLFHDSDFGWPFETCSMSGDVYGSFAVNIDPEGIYPEGTPLLLHIQAPYGPKINPQGWSISTAWSVSLEGQEIGEDWMELDVFSGDTLEGVFDLAVDISMTGPHSLENPQGVGDVNMYLTPEPATLALVALGTTAALGRRKRK